MKIYKNQAIQQDWDEVKSWNYKLKQLKTYQSVVYAELKGEHGEVETKDVERVYFIVEGKGEFEINKKTVKVEKGDVVTVPAKTIYNYRPIKKSTLKVLLFMELWDN